MVFSEYLIFNLVVFVPPFAFGLTRRFSFKRQIGASLFAVILIAPWFVIWDSLVTGRHWWFNPKYVSGIYLFSLPLEELTFFVTVPFACLFTWEMLLRRTEMRRQSRLVFVYLLLSILGILGVPIFFTGREYTALVLLSLALSAALDFGLRTYLLKQPRFYAFLGLVLLFTLVFNGYLTARPVVIYDSRYQLDIRITTVPIEDFIYGISLVIACVSVFEWYKNRFKKGEHAA